jgi:broad specificity phosphatase PhoE
MLSPKIMIIRHGEKPAKGAAGVDRSGCADENGLVPRGWQRAGGLAALFRSPPPGLATPAHLFACHRPKHSRRALDTVAPLAEALGLEVSTRVQKGDEVGVAAMAVLCGGPVLISWEHEAIRDIAAALTHDPVPADWPAERFDVVYVLDLEGEIYRFSQVPQRLLAGDLDAGIPV